MTDKELLELAAKAAGLVIDKSTTNGGGFGNTGFNCLGDAVLDWHNYKTWNPLVDDGAAFRLATKLSLLVNTDATESQATDGKGVDECEIHHNGDSNAATRRVIVRAAAEIGKRLK